VVCYALIRFPEIAIQEALIWGQLSSRKADG